MLLLPSQLLQQIQAYDKSLDLLFNGRTRRWVVVQKLPKWLPVCEKLRGVSSIHGDYSNYKFMFVCETEDGIPVEPGPWVVRRIWEVAPMAQEHRLIEERERMIEEQREAEFQREVADLCDDTRYNLDKYAGISRYGGEDARLAKRHVIIGNP